MRIDGDAAAVVRDRQEAVGGQLDLDEGGVAGQRLVHAVVDHFGEEVMQRLLVGAADIHAGTAPDRLQPLQHLDVARGVAGLGAGGGLRRGLGFRGGSGKKVVVLWLFQCFRHISSCVAREGNRPNRFP